MQIRLASRPAQARWAAENSPVAPFAARAVQLRVRQEAVSRIGAPVPEHVLTRRAVPVFVWAEAGVVAMPRGQDPPITNIWTGLLVRLDMIPPRVSVVLLRGPGSEQT